MSPGPAAAAPLPAAARRLFPHHAVEDLTPERAGALLIARLFEDGDGADLAWLTSAFAEERLAAWLAERGGRQLSARSRAFWEVVLGERAPLPVASGLWPL
ncbi:MAG TPA: hypothetical protein VF121_08225 [Thermoanaerobaculia bacterium]|nr:hypothetical protein [Thermoanaerobaculia bacterium]